MRLAANLPVLVLPLLFSVAGCSTGHGVPLAPVSGTVQYNGSPLADAEIVFYPDHGRPAYGKVRNGRIEEVHTFDPNDGVTVGKCRIIIRALQRGADMYTPSTSLIPARYANAETSGLTAEIKHDGKNELTLKLSDQAAP